ncbi:MAG TPA: TIGR03435 family protein [Bryobacteraceae bacterium]|jgi:uncharacterized protein (TIGR03435 family)|nr:TIGR03435 family protein [Bryobacteraceae bacterium]
MRPYILVLFAPALLCAQQFEVASIKPSGPAVAEQAKIGVRIDGAQVNCTALNLRDYIGIAGKLKLYQISGPEWLGGERFDINAKLPEGATGSQVPAMLMALLEERFQMKSHRETKEFPVFALVVGKGGLKVAESPMDPASGPDEPVAISAAGAQSGVTINLGRGSYFSVAANRLEAKKITTASFADALARFVDRPILDLTGLKGTYDFTLDVSPEDFSAMIVRSALSAGVQLPPQAMRALDASGDTLFSAIEKLGLKLEPRKGPVEILVIDHMEKNPTAN